MIFIFGGSHPDPWQTAAQAYHKGLGKTVLVTGGHKPGVQPHFTWADGSTPEAHVIKRELVKLSVPESCIFYEDKSTNTFENVIFAKEVYDFSGVHRILVVCKNYGVGRQCRTLRQQVDKNVKVIPYPFDTEAGSSELLVTRDNWMDHEKSRILVLTQVIRIIHYGKSGHLTPLEYMSPALEQLVGEFSQVKTHPPMKSSGIQNNA